MCEQPPPHLLDAKGATRYAERCQTGNGVVCKTTAPCVDTVGGSTPSLSARNGPDRTKPPKSIPLDFLETRQAGDPVRKAFRTESPECRCLDQQHVSVFRVPCSGIGAAGGLDPHMTPCVCAREAAAKIRVTGKRRVKNHAFKTSLAKQRYLFWLTCFAHACRITPNIKRGTQCSI